MDPILAGGGMIAGLIGAELTNNANRDMQNSANNTNIQLANENRAFQERMSNTAHQREADDLAKAGMNRILTATKGSGASTPAGGAATVQAARMDNAIGAGLSSAKDALNYDLQRKSTEADIALKAASTSAQAAQAAQSISSAKNIDADTAFYTPKTANLHHDTLNKRGQGDLQAAELARIATESQGWNAKAMAEKAENINRRKQAAWDSKAMTYDNIMNRAEQATGMISNFIPKFRFGGADPKEHSDLKRENKTMKDYINRRQGR